MKFIATNKAKMDQIPVESGQMIFSRDDRVIYLDTDVRTSFQQIITLVSNDQRTGLINPVPGFYFVKQTKILWHYDDNEWTLVGNGGSGSEPQIIFDDFEDFPAIGEVGILYVDKTTIYRWDFTTQKYYAISGRSQWEEI